jgi:hypothetical protein
MTEEQIVAELKLTQGFRWSEALKFEGLQLLELPLIVDAARSPKGTDQRVRALRGKLEAVRTRIGKAERGQSSNRSVADAGAAVLRLDSRFEDMPLEEIRIEVAARWPKLDGKGYVKPGHFRANVEEPKVLVPFARELRKMMGERKKTGPSSKGESVRKANGSIEAAMAEFLGRMERQTLEERLRAIDKNGLLAIRDEDEMLQILLECTALAKRNLRAVDVTPTKRWCVPGALKKYLDQQLKLVKKEKISLQRIHVVDEQVLLKEPSLSGEILGFVKKHEAAHASVLLCPSGVFEELSTAFREKRGLLLVDGDEAGETLAVTGKLNPKDVGEAYVYLREHDTVKDLRREYAQLCECIEADNHDSKLRKGLETMAREGKPRPRAGKKQRSSGS